MFRITIRKKHLILIIAIALISLVTVSFFVFKSKIKNGDSVKDTSVNVKTISTVTPNNDNQPGIGKSRSTSDSQKSVYTDAQVKDTLVYFFGPLPNGYTATVEGTEIKNGTEYYKVKILNNNQISPIFYYADPKTGKIFMLDPTNNSLIPAIKVNNTN